MGYADVSTNKVWQVSEYEIEGVHWKTRKNVCTPPQKCDLISKHVNSFYRLMLTQT
jgi:hypothetical protein